MIRVFQAEIQFMIGVSCDGLIHRLQNAQNSASKHLNIDHIVCARIEKVNAVSVNFTVTFDRLVFIRFK